MNLKEFALSHANTKLINEKELAIKELITPIQSEIDVLEAEIKSNIKEYIKRMEDKYGITSFKDEWGNTVYKIGLNHFTRAVGGDTVIYSAAFKRVRDGKIEYYWMPDELIGVIEAECCIRRCVWRKADGDIFYTEMLRMKEIFNAERDLKHSL